MVDIGLMLVGEDECKLMPLSFMGYPSLAFEFGFLAPAAGRQKQATEDTEGTDKNTE